MNSILDSIHYLARAEARHYAPSRVVDTELNYRIPYLSIESVPGSSSESRKYRVIMNGHRGHDNEGRADFVCSFLRTSVLPYIDPLLDVSGFYPMELHDSYTYLSSDQKNHKTYRGVLTFSKDMTHTGPILFPDTFQLSAYGGLLGTKDVKTWETKKPSVMFAGTTTGSRDPACNDRIRACRWALETDPSRFRFKITSIAQMILDPKQLASLEPLMSKHITPQEQFDHRYIFNIRGNTCCWSRVPMILNSNSLMLNWRHADGTWYYPLLHEGTHYAGIENLEDLPTLVSKCENNPGWCNFLVQNANHFVRSYCKQFHAAAYARYLLEAMSENKW